MIGPSSVNERIALMRTAVLGTLREQCGAEADGAHCFFVPGRIEVLGKHTDYAGGRSLLAAVDRGFVIAAVPRPDDVVCVINSSSGERIEIQAGEVRSGIGNSAVGSSATGAMRDAAGGGSPDGYPSAPRAVLPAWGRYPLTVVRRSCANFPEATGGADIAFTSDLPQAAGLSSSSALVVATFLVLDAVRGMSETGSYAAAIRDNAELAGYLGAVENGMTFGALAGEPGVGTMGGSEDHTAILNARAGRLVQFSYAPVHFEDDVAMPAGWTFVVGATGVRAEKAGAALARYNRLSADAQLLVRLWHEEAGSAVTSARRNSRSASNPMTLAGITVDPDAALRLRELVRHRGGAQADRLLARLAQFTAESDEIVPAARAALDRGDMTGFSALVSRSQQLAEHALENQVPETTHLVDTARPLGATAASSFGAGFGGSVWALVRESEAAVFLHDWRSQYHERFPERGDASEFFITPAAGPATRLGGGS
jgi:galactokinase